MIGGDLLDGIIFRVWDHDLELLAFNQETISILLNIEVEGAFFNGGA